MARTLGSWMSGSDPSSDTGPNDYPGQRLGLPESGSGSIARFGRRIAALLIDWFIAYGLAALAMSLGLLSLNALSTAVLVVWFLLGVVSVRLFGFTPGQLVLGLRVASVDRRIHVGVGRAAVRGLLIALVIPALFTDSDFRGYQDRFTNTAVVRR
ncbi:RDD family protein [Mycobacterium sp. B14F4]|uniref:RDD family protein n=1 Tax=Mycobacterium sp. B14F4 TaxID=3153565 RepID=UPI00325E2B7F